MDQRTQGILLVVIMIALSLVFQVQVKLFATSLAPALARAESWHGAVNAFIKNCVTWRGLLIVVLAGLLFLIWILALTRLELSFALPIASIAFVVTAVGGGLWLGEQLSWSRVFGLITTAIGIGLVVKS